MKLYIITSKTQFQLPFLTPKNSIQNTIPDQLHVITSRTKKSHQNIITNQLYISFQTIPIFIIHKFNYNQKIKSYSISNQVIPSLPQKASIQNTNSPNQLRVTFTKRIH